MARTTLASGIFYQFGSKEDLLEYLHKQARDLRAQSATLGTVGAHRYRDRAFEVEQVIMVLENSNVTVEPWRTDLTTKYCRRCFKPLPPDGEERDCEEIGFCTD